MMSDAENDRLDDGGQDHLPPEEQDPRHVHAAPGARAEAMDDAAGTGLEELRAERDDLLGRLQRLGADFQNYQKRIRRDMDQASEYAHADLLKALLPVLDDLERAIEHARSNHPADDPLLVGVELVQRKAIETLGRFGLEPIATQGRPFDPDVHQAIVRQPTGEAEPMTVLAEVEKGYRLKGRVLRPAKVVVAVAP